MSLSRRAEAGHAWYLLKSALVRTLRKSRIYVWAVPFAEILCLRVGCAYRAFPCRGAFWCALSTTNPAVTLTRSAPPSLTPEACYRGTSFIRTPTP